MHMNITTPLDSGYHAASVYSRGITEPHGRILLNGQQALVRLLLAQAAADRARGLKTGGFVSGYRGSPLGGLDRELWSARELLEQAQVRFLPAINEDLAATALLGTQRVESDPARRVDGVFGMWYGKGPGVDRSGDAIKHGNAYGSSPHGGVLVVAGDDHGCVSSSMSHQSDRTLVAWGLPVVHPSGLDDYERCGLWGWALSRASGLWVGFKAITETVEATASVDTAELPPFRQPQVNPGPDGLHWRWPDLPGMQIERRFAHKLDAVRAFVAANPLDRAHTQPQQPRLAILAVGKAWLDVREALRRAGLTLERMERAGVALVEVNLVHPVSAFVLDWARRATTVLVIEEKQPVVEEQIKDALYGSTAPGHAVLGKLDHDGTVQLSCHDEIRPSHLAPLLQRHLLALGVDDGRFEAPVPAPQRQPEWLRRTPYFCSGCPHNTSTRVPAGSEARLGIGCHAMAARMPERATTGSVQMGGEGVDWLGQAPFVNTPHIFQNIGDGTFFHSGYLAVRQAVACGATITYKLLYNDAVAMTGGQPIDGQLTVAKAAALLKAEGVAQVVVVAHEPERYAGGAIALPAGVDLFGREQLDAVQRRLREMPGVTVLIYDQVCALQARRRAKQSCAPARGTRVIINESVCEGCGDCQQQSNCLSVVPVNTPLGVKRAIDPHSCSVDLSCLKGDCPSFVTVSGTPLPRARQAADADEVLARALVLPAPVPQVDLSQPLELLFVGIGGTGVVTAARLVALAAHLQGLRASQLDFTGFTQKGGSVLSHLRLARQDQTLNQYRIDRVASSVLLAADLVVASDNDVLAALSPQRARVIANTSETQTGEMLRRTDATIDSAAILRLLGQIVGQERVDTLDARGLAEALADPQQANLLLLGYAWQRGVLPLSLAALQQALKVQGGNAKTMGLAFAWGRLWADDPDYVRRHLPVPVSDALRPVPLADPAMADPAQAMAWRMDHLRRYQNAAYARHYQKVVDKVARSAARLGDRQLADAVARGLFTLMARKDEYEVARLLTEPAFLKQASAGFAPGAELTFHIAPTLLHGPRREDQPPRKLRLTGRFIPLLRLLAAARVLRHTPLDVFAWSADRLAERRFLDRYEETLLALLPYLRAHNLELFLEWARLPESIRGFGRVRQRAVEAAYRRQEALARRILHDSAHAGAPAPDPVPGLLAQAVS
jgi:indolepyruvate ferredoxin oxidoreductase